MLKSVLRDIKERHARVALDHKKGCLFLISDLNEKITIGFPHLGELAEQFSAFKSNIFYAGGGIYAPPMISRKKKFFAQFLLNTQTTTQNRVTHQKPGLYLEKQKNGSRFKITE